MRKFKNYKLSRKIIAGMFFPIALGGVSQDLGLKTYAVRQQIAQILDQNRQYTKEELLSMMEDEFRSYEHALNQYEELYNQTFPEHLDTLDEMTDGVHFKHGVIIETIKTTLMARVACKYVPGTLEFMRNMNDLENETSLTSCWTAPNGSMYSIAANSPSLNCEYLKAIINFLNYATGAINEYIEAFNTDLENKDTPTGLNTHRDNFITGFARNIAENTERQGLTADSVRGEAATVYWDDKESEIQASVLANLRSLDLTYDVIVRPVSRIIENFINVIQEEEEQIDYEDENIGDADTERVL